MKVQLEIDATPEEWRKFFGMPDVSELHEEIIKQAKDKINSGQYDPITLMQQFTPENLQKMTNMQQNFWESLFKPK